MQAPYSGSLQQGRPDRERREQPRPCAHRDESRPKPAHGGDHHPGDQQQNRVGDRDGPGEIPPASKEPLIVPIEFLEEHEKQIEIAPAEAERDRQQNRGGRGEGDPARRMSGGAFGRT